MASAILWVLKHSALQFLSLCGVLFISGLVLTYLSRWTSNAFRQFVAPKLGLYLFGVIGVPLHEFCHAFFAKVFFHDISSIKWFDPKGKGGAHGAVVHYYNERNIYHRVGLFFIGLGPVLLAPLFLFAIYSLLLPHPVAYSAQWGNPGYLASQFAKSLFGAGNWSSVGFYVFLYLAVCLTSQMELSSEDFKIARGGVLPILGLLLFLNIVSYAFHLNWHQKFAVGFQFCLVWWSGLIAAAVLISLLNLLLCTVVLSALNKLCGQKTINPFRE